MAKTGSGILAGGSANAAKLIVAALTFTAAYVGLSAYGSADSAPAPTAHLTAAERPIIATVAQEPAVAAGRIGISTQATGPSCLRTYVARSLIVNPAPRETVSYKWRLSRWNPGTNTWRTYLVDYSGFAGAEHRADWLYAISANPGWYRVELKAEGRETVRSDRFQVSC